MSSWTGIWLNLSGDFHWLYRVYVNTSIRKLSHVCRPPSWHVARVIETIHCDMWSELLKQIAVTCEASYWNKSLWQVKRVIEANHCDRWTTEASYWNKSLWYLKRDIESKYSSGRCITCTNYFLMEWQNKELTWETWLISIGRSYLQTVSHLFLNQARKYTRYLTKIRWYFLLVFCSLHFSSEVCHDIVKN
jgi:hypothetical protein